MPAAAFWWLLWRLVAPAFCVACPCVSSGVSPCVWVVLWGLVTRHGAVRCAVPLRLRCLPHAEEVTGWECPCCCTYTHAFSSSPPCVVHPSPPVLVGPSHCTHAGQAAAQLPTGHCYAGVSVLCVWCRASLSICIGGIAVDSLLPGWAASCGLCTRVPHVTVPPVAASAALSTATKNTTTARSLGGPWAPTSLRKLAPAACVTFSVGHLPAPKTHVCHTARAVDAMCCVAQQVRRVMMMMPVQRSMLPAQCSKRPRGKHAQQDWLEFLGTHSIVLQ